MTAEGIRDRLQALRRDALALQRDMRDHGLDGEIGREHLDAALGEINGALRVFPAPADERDDSEPPLTDAERAVLARLGIAT